MNSSIFAQADMALERELRSTVVLSNANQRSRTFFSRLLAVSTVLSVAALGVMVGRPGLKSHQASSAPTTSAESQGPVPAGAVVASSAKRTTTSTRSGLTYNWRPVRIGGGGMVTGLDVSTDGSRVLVRTDTYGAYSWSKDAKEWVQLLTDSSLPLSKRAPGYGAGLLGLTMAPSRPARVYAAFRGLIYRSEDGGKKFAKTGFSGSEFDANGATRAWGPRLAVDPSRPDVVLFGSVNDGLFVSKDGGSRWIKTSVPAGGEANGMRAGITFVGFATSGTGNRMVAASAGEGWWESTDDGGTWNRVDGGPQTVVSADVGTDGLIAAVPFDQTSPGQVWLLESGVWRAVPIGAEFRGESGALEVTTVAIDKRDPARLMVVGAGGDFWISRNRGASWVQLKTSVGRGDVPWLNSLIQAEGYLTVGDFAFDPQNPDSGYLTMGVGVVRVTGLKAGGGAVLTMQSRGIEQLVVSRVVAPPGGPLVVAVHDFGVMTIPDVTQFNLFKGPSNRFIGSWDVAYSPFSPQFLVADTVNLINDGDMLAGPSTDGGRTWAAFPQRPRGEPATNRDRDNVKFTGCGAMVVSEPSNILWVPSGAQAPWLDNRYAGCFVIADGREALLPHVTQDGGQTWTAVLLPGVSDDSDDVAGFHRAYYLHRRPIAADQVKPGVFYLQHAGKGTFRSVDRGATWERMSDQLTGDEYSFNLDMHAVPNHEGHLFLTAGGQGGSKSIGPDDYTGGPFFRTTDGGRSWKEIAGMTGVVKFGFGKPEKSGGYPTIFAAGMYRGTYGLWRSTDEGRSWMNIGTFPGGSLDGIASIDGDKSKFGFVYIGMQGSGVVVGSPAAAR